MAYRQTVGAQTFVFGDLRELMAKATPMRSGDMLAGIAATSQQERIAACMCLADLPLKAFLSEAVVPYEQDEVTRLIVDTHDRAAFTPLAHLTVGDFRDWLLSDRTTTRTLAGIAPGITPEMAAAAAKIMRNQDLILVARKCTVVTRFRNTIGLAGTMAVRLQPNHPTDDKAGITAAILDGLLYGCGDAVIGINPASDSVAVISDLLMLLDDIIRRYDIPTQGCVLTHVTTSLDLIRRGAPVDLVFQSVAGTQAANAAFGINLAVLGEAREAARGLKRGTVGDNVMYFETGQGSALSAGAHHGVDQQTCEARAYGVCRAFAPLLVNTVVGFIGPEYLYDGKQIVRAGLEDHFCGKLMGLPFGCDVCYTNHAEADQDDMDTLLTLLATAGVTYVMGVPGADDIMLNYQSTSFHDQLYLRELLDRRRAPEFEAWLRRMGITGPDGRLSPRRAAHPLLAASLVPGHDGSPSVTDDPWQQLARLTPARIALGRVGASLPTSELLAFSLAHAKARDAVHQPLDAERTRRAIAELGFETCLVESAAASREIYLRRPDLGRRLSPASRTLLEAVAPVAPCDLALVVADGLSAAAVEAQAVPLLTAFQGWIRRARWSVSTVAIARQARVALGDEIGELMRAQAVAVLIGERPGLSSPDSLGVYLTFAPRAGRTDAERNCISNIRGEGLPHEVAAFKLGWLCGEALRRRLSGVTLKDESDHALRRGDVASVAATRVAD